MREKPQLDLRVVGRKQLPPRPWDEPSPNITSQLSANGDVLQVRVARGETSRRRHCLVERRVQPACLRVDEGRKRVEIRILELRQLTILHESLWQLMALLGELLKHA